MKNEIKIFESEQFGAIRMVGTSDEPKFCLTDICRVLDLQAAAVMRRLGDGVTTNHPITDTLGRTQVAIFVNEDGLYDVIFESRKPEAKAFRKWVTAEVLPSIRKTGTYTLPKKKLASVSQVRSHYEAIKLKKELLNLNDNSVAILINKADEQLGIEGQKIDYTPSKGILKPISVLLKEHNIPMSARKANEKLLELGYLRINTRKGKKGQKKFYSITEKGEAFGENQVSMHNPQETQPLWYSTSFNNLLNNI